MTGAVALTTAVEVTGAGVVRAAVDLMGTLLWSCPTSPSRPWSSSALPSA